MAEPRRRALSLVHRVRPPGEAPAAGTRPPLLLLLHGVGSNELAMTMLAGWFDARFLVVSARAPNSLVPFAFGWLHEVVGSGGLVVDPADLNAALAAITRFLDEVLDAYAADPDRVYIAGFSQGGIVAMAMLLTAPEAVAGVVCMSGRLPREVLTLIAPTARLRGKHALIVHGRADVTLGVAEGRAAYETLRELQLAVDYAELDMGHTTTDESLSLVSAWLTRKLAP